MMTLKERLRFRAKMLGWTLRSEKNHLIERWSGRNLLTGLGNRYRLQRDLKSKAVLRAKMIAYVVADIDGFRHVSDTYGIAVSDSLLREIAEQVFQVRCPDSAKPFVKAYRKGGDSFCVLATDIGDNAAMS